MICLRRTFFVLAIHYKFVHIHIYIRRTCVLRMPYVAKEWQFDRIRAAVRSRPLQSHFALVALWMRGAECVSARSNLWNVRILHRGSILGDHHTQI